MTPIEEPQEVELPRGLVAEASAPLPVIQHEDGSTEPAPASSVYAKDIIGLLTNEQIEELEAAKISGQLTPEQIEAINAAQIIGQIVDSQIKGIGANKLEGFVEGTQIAAETITGGNIKALTVTSGKIAAEAITTEKIAALNVTTAKLAANAITAEKISAGAITTTKLAASAVTAEKLSVVELSAIVANAGKLTSGTIEGLNIILPVNTGSIEEPTAISKVSWIKETFEDAYVSASLEGSGATGQVNMRYMSNPKGTRNHSLTTMMGYGKEKKSSAGFQARASSEVEGSYAIAFVGGFSVTIYDDKERASFLQLSSKRKERDFGLVTELPKGTLVVGDRCKYYADKTNGIVWDLVYDGEGTRPWKKIGGPPLFAEAEGEVEFNSAAFIGTEPAVTCALIGDYLVEVGCRFWGTVAGNYGYFSYKIGGTAAQIADSYGFIGTGAVGVAGSRCKKKAIAAGTTLTCQYRNEGGGATFIRNRWIRVDPIRVG